MKKTVIAAMLGLLAAALALGDKPDPEVLLREKRIIDPSPEGLTLVFHLILRNPSDAPVRLTRYDYKVVIDDTEYLNLKVQLDDPLGIEAGDEIVIGLPVKLNYGNLFPAAPGLEDKDLAVCYVAGGMTFQDEKRRDKRVPVAFSGDFPVYRGLEFVPVPVEVKTLTIGGAEITAGFAIRNPNGFSFSLDRLTYSLELAGYSAIKGETGTGTRIAARGEKIFTFPLILDFFETGGSVADGLNESVLDVRVSGESEVTTPWGRWVIAFDRTVKTAVRK
ncbi:MAG: LEA type 2 family protein [Candidatus Aminicenantes bacterium]|nr:LEA type 2 family protein [Candidatus Aminicenantes bacterium]